MRSEFLPYCRPAIDADDIATVASSMQRGWLTTGPAVNELENAIAAASGIKHAVALNSCTAALHLGLIALGVGHGDEVVMPSLTFVAGAQCARQLGAVPVFCDVDPATLSVSVETIDKVVTDRTKVIMPMHYGGRPAPMKQIVAYARSKGIKVLEDAAHALGTLYEGEWPGVFSDAAAYSFYPTKNITTGEGGILLTNADALMERVRMLALHGMDRDAWKRYTRGGKWRYDVVATGYKYNMPDMAAALGCSQLRKLESLQKSREQLARQYIDGLHDLPGIRCASQFLDPPSRHSWCMFVVLVDEEQAGISRDALIDRLQEANIGTSVHYIPTHLFSAYRDTPHAPLPVTDAVWPQLLSLPLYPGLTAADVNDVIGTLRSILSDAVRSTAIATIRV
jgi:dTDP-4-amino-4,6-dideoxygalactose transaminase